MKEKKKLTPLSLSLFPSLYFYSKSKKKQEYQVGPCVGIDGADMMWMSRYILVRIAEVRLKKNILLSIVSVFFPPYFFFFFLASSQTPHLFPHLSFFSLSLPLPLPLSFLFLFLV